jgi:D-sedoheptulose 7-phosphate isomerase
MLEKNTFNAEIEESILLHRNLIYFEDKINLSIKKIVGSLRKGGKIMLCGNGGSAADAQHLAAEFIVRLNPKINRKPYSAISLAQDTSTITACGNDYSFEDIFLRTFKALYKKSDILIVISTSGNSKNIIKLLKFSKQKKIYSIGFLGRGGGQAKKFVDCPIVIDNEKVHRIQECHIFLGHYIFNQVEKCLLKK